MLDLLLELVSLLQAFKYAVCIAVWSVFIGLVAVAVLDVCVFQAVRERRRKCN